MSSPPPTQGVEQPPQTVELFLKTILRSGILSSPQLQTALQPVPPDRLKDAKFLANHLVKTGLLSRFQADKMLQGVTKGLVLGPFHVLAPIGKGGMGAVFLARDSRNQQLVAIKALPPKRAKAEERLLARFRREMEICQRVAHPNVARTYEVGTEDDVHFIAMEYIPGKNLYKLVSEEGQLTLPRAARLFQEICLGLEHANGQGLIHRDIKPSNIVITPDDHAKLLDLGLALMAGEVQADRTVVGGQGYIVGTLDYLAPEQADDAFAVDVRSDIYALGCTLYFALTKQPPFPGGNALQKLLRHRCDTPVAVNRLNPAVPPEFVAVVEKMMAKRKEERFATATQVREALRPWSPDSPKPPVIEATPKPSPSPGIPAPLPPASAAGAPPVGAKPAPTSSVFKKNAGSLPPLPRLAPTPLAEPPSTKQPAVPPAPPRLPPPVAAEQASPVPAPAPKPAVEPPNSWFVEMARQAGTEPPPQAGPLAGVAKAASAPAPLESAPLATLVPVPPISDQPNTALPFWLDYLIPVCAGGLFLFVVWLLGLIWLLKR
jgi:serine/threonine protein kinase